MLVALLFRNADRSYPPYSELSGAFFQVVIAMGVFLTSYCRKEAKKPLEKEQGMYSHHDPMMIALNGA